MSGIFACASLSDIFPDSKCFVHCLTQNLNGISHCKISFSWNSEISHGNFCMQILSSSSVFSLNIRGIAFHVSRKFVTFQDRHRATNKPQSAKEISLNFSFSKSVLLGKISISHGFYSLVFQMKIDKLKPDFGAIRVISPLMRLACHDFVLCALQTFYNSFCQENSWF